MLKIFIFECIECKVLSEALVEGIEGKPDRCTSCGSVGGFVKCVSSPTIMNTIIPSYPGSKRLKAGYQHTHARPAEKGKSQVSFAGITKK